MNNINTANFLSFFDISFVCLSCAIIKKKQYCHIFQTKEHLINTRQRSWLPGSSCCVVWFTVYNIIAMLGKGGGCFALRLSGCCGHIGHQSSHCDTVTSDLSHATKKHCAVHKALVSGRECANNTVHSNRISHPSGSLLSYLCTAPIRTVYRIALLRKYYRRFV